MRPWSPLLLALAIGCQGGSFTVAVELKTDLAPGIEFTEVEISLGSFITPPHLAESSADYIAGVRLADIGDVTAGTHLLTAVVKNGTEVVIVRRVRVDVDGNQGVTVIVTRDCRGVTCPTAADPSATACLSGRCVDEGCSPENPDACPAPACTADVDCVATAACAIGHCESGACLFADDGSCGAGRYCDPDSDCQGAPGPTDFSPSLDEVPTFSTGSGTFVPVPAGEVTLPPLADGASWLVLVSANIGSTSTEQVAAEVRLMVDGVERGYGGTQNSTASSPGPFQHFVVVDGAASATLAVELRDAAGGMATVGDLRIVRIAIPSSADLHYAESNPEVMFADPAFAPKHTLDFTPSAPGDYILLMAVAAGEGPEERDADVRWTGPSGAPFPIDYFNVRRPLQSFFLAEVVTLADTSPQTLVLEAETRGTGLLRTSHLLAMRADAFADVAETRFESELGASVGETILAAELTSPGMAGSPDVVVMQTTVVGSSCPDLPHARRVSFEVADAVVSSYAHIVDNCAYVPGYTAFSYVNDPTDVLVQSFVAPDGPTDTVDAVGVFIIALRF